MKKRINSKNYPQLLTEIQLLLKQARSAAARSVNAVMTATYWEVGRQIVVYEQRGKKRADYGEKLLERLSRDLNRYFGRGFGLPQAPNSPISDWRISHNG